MPSLLVVHHSPTPSVRSLTDSVVAGAGHEQLAEVSVVVRSALEASVEDVLAADGFVLITPANFGYMSGALKHFFDSVFLQAGGALGSDGQGDGAPGASRTSKPYGLAVHGRYDTAGAVRSVQIIVGALPWRQGADVLEVVGDVTRPHMEQASELGATIAALVLG